jgi:hypothetical protein
LETGGTGIAKPWKKSFGEGTVILVEESVDGTDEVAQKRF